MPETESRSTTTEEANCLHYVHRSRINSGIEYSALCGALDVWDKEHDEAAEFHAVCPACFIHWSRLRRG